MKMYVKMITDPTWIGKNIKSLIALAAFLWGILTFVIGYITAVNGAVEGVKNHTPRIEQLEQNDKALGGKVDTVITLLSYQILGRTEEAKEYLKSHPPDKP